MAMRKAGYTPKKRNSYARKRSSIVLVATEGKNETETRYLKDFVKAYGKTLRFAGGTYTDPINMAKVLEKKSKELEPDEGDKAYCLIDSDFKSKKNEEIAKADEIAAQNGFRVLVSSPSYGKSKDKMFDLTKDKIEDAIRNAEKLRSACERAGYRPHTIDFLPSTEIDILAREIMKSEN